MSGHSKTEWLLQKSAYILRQKLEMLGKTKLASLFVFEYVEFSINFNGFNLLPILSTLFLLTAIAILLFH